MRIIAAIHDVTPAFPEAVETLWDMCRCRGLTPALFVVPSWHGEWHLEDHPRFVAWVRRCAHLGAEVFLHGERHDEVGSHRELAHELRAFGRTNREGEFLTLDRTAARNRIARGLRRLIALGLRPVGFVAPAWLASAGTNDAAADAGLTSSEDDECIHLVDRAQRVPAPVIRWSARTTTRAHASVLVAAAARALRRDPIIRVALHPSDVHSRPVRRSVMRTLDAYKEHAWPTQYS